MTALYEMINILPLSLLSVMLFGTYAGVPERSIFACVLSAAFSAWMIALRSMKPKNRLRSIGIAAVFLVGLGLAAGEEYRLMFVSGYFWVVWVVCLSAAALAAGLLVNRSIWAKRAEAVGLIVYCAVGTVLRSDIGKEVFALICFVVLVRVAEEIQRRWKKSGDRDMEGHITRISPLFIAVCLAVYLLPAPGKPYGWQFAKSIYYSTVSCFNRIYGYIAHRSDDYGNIGFSDNGGFLSGLGETDEEVLRISTSDQKTEDLRLVGCISGEFTGREWVFGSGSESDPRMTDTMETSCAVRKYAPSNRSDYLKDMSLDYETLFFNTKYVFSPAKIRVAATKSLNSGISEKNGSIVTEKRLNYKDTYSVSCFVLNYGNPHLREFLTNAEPIGEDDWKQTAAAEGVINKDGFSYGDYLEYRREVYEDYCRSYGLSEDARRITDGIKNSSSDRYEAAKKLEAYLRRYEYSADCGALPESVTDAGSFLDYFLFTSKKGYCMHFATAFALMANEMGIPCRYVQGYNVKRDSGGGITVRQSSAHAWCEVYFDNVGWIAFEPTPGFAVSSGWEVKDTNAEAPEEDPFAYEAELPQTDADDIPEAPEEEKTKLSPLIFIIPTAAVIGFLLMFYLISRSVSRKKYSRMSPHDKFRFLAQQDIRFIGLLGVGIREGETLTEFSDRIRGSDRKDIAEHLGFIPLYESVLYSDREMTAEDVTAAESTNRALRGLVKKHRLRSRLMLMIKDR